MLTIRPCPSAAHDLQNGGHAVEDAVEVHRQHTSELGGAVVLREVLLTLDAGVVEEPVDAPEPLDGDIDVPLDVVDLRHVGDDGDDVCVGSHTRHQPCGLVQGGGIEVDEHEVCALGGQPFSRGSAQAGPGSRHDHDLVGEALHEASFWAGNEGP